MRPKDYCNGKAIDREKGKALELSVRVPQRQEAPDQRRGTREERHARFDQVDSKICHPTIAKRRIVAAAKKFGIDVSEFQRSNASRALAGKAKL